MSGIQLGFEDGTRSTLLESDNANTEVLKEIEIDPSRTIRAISMLLYYGRNIEGLRFYDNEMNFIIDITWDHSSAGSWTDPQFIPEDMQIIGVKAVTHYENWIRGIDFVLGPLFTPE